MPPPPLAALQQLLVDLSSKITNKLNTSSTTLTNEQIAEIASALVDLNTKLQSFVGAEKNQATKDELLAAYDTFMAKYGESLGAIQLQWTDIFRNVIIMLQAVSYV